MVKVLVWECREAQRLSLRELAELSGVSKSTLQRVESGRRSPTLEQLDHIADALNISITQLYERHKRNC